MPPVGYINKDNDELADESPPEQHGPSTNAIGENPQESENEQQSAANNEMKSPHSRAVRGWIESGNFSNIPLDVVSIIRIELHQMEINEFFRIYDESITEENDFNDFMNIVLNYCMCSPGLCKHCDTQRV